MVVCVCCVCVCMCVCVCVDDGNLNEVLSWKIYIYIYIHKCWSCDQDDATISLDKVVTCAGKVSPEPLTIVVELQR